MESAMLFHHLHKQDNFCDFTVFILEYQAHSEKGSAL